MFILHFILGVVYFIERCFGEGFLATILVDGISNTINDISLFGFLKNVSSFPNKTNVLKFIPVFNLATKALMLFVLLKVLNTPSSVAVDRKEVVVVEMKAGGDEKPADERPTDEKPADKK
ncbi:hypothetical protein HanIR_Chr11g0548431 [Helianthus annuus]|nr:hypothetical protein HanIR_Chr11g0548431 [Helianthus annuus]